MKFGHNMTKICDLFWGQGICDKDDQLVEDAKLFQKLYQKETKVSSQSLKNMRHKKLDKSKELPHSEDIQKLNNGLKADMAKLTNKIEENASVDCCLELAKHVLIYVTVYSQKRGGEMAKSTVKNYTDAKASKKEVHDDQVLQNLSKFEREVATHHLLVKVIGKKSRHVRALMPNFVC